MKSMRSLIYSAFFLTACLAAGADVEKENERTRLPEKEVLAAAEKWKLQQLGDRLRQSGATGQQEVFFEILELCDSKPEARADSNLEAIMSFLLFDAGLWNAPNIREPAFVRVPALFTKTGARMLDTRMNAWLANVSMQPNGNEPWLWPEYKRVDPKALTEAAGRLAATPRHNPVARMWVAGLMLAVDAPDAEKEYAAAIKKVEANYASQSKLAAAQLLESLASNGVRNALPLMLEQAEIEGQQVLPIRTRGSYYDETRSATSLARLFQLLSLPPMQPKAPNGTPDTATEIAKLKPWLKANLANLSWDATKRCYVSDAAPPGMEVFFSAARALEKSYDFKCLERIARGPYEMTQVYKDLIALMEKNPAAAADPRSEELLLVLLDRQPQMGYDDRTVLLTQLPKINRKLGVSVIARSLKQAMANPNSGVESFLQQLEPDAALLPEVFASLLPEYQKAYDAARTGNDVDAALTAAMSLLFVGGKPDRQQVVELLAKAPPAWTAGRYDSKLGRWLASMNSSKRTGYLRLLLINGARDLETYGQKNRRDTHPLGMFQFACGWTDNSVGIAGTGAEVLAQCEEWLDKHESQLKWDAQRSRFTGVLSPQKLALARTLEPLSKYGLKATDEFFEPGYERDNMRRLLESVLALADAKPEAAKDPAVGKAIQVLFEPARAGDHDALAKRVYVQLPRTDREAGLNLWTELVRKDLDYCIKNWSASTQIVHESRMPDADPTIIKAARARLLPDYRKLVELPASTPAEKCAYALACVYLGEPLDAGKLEKLITEADKQVTTRRVNVTQWATMICQTGNNAGLRIFLLHAGINPNNQGSLQSFEQYSGVYNQNLRRELPRDNAARLQVYLNWFNTFEKQFTYNPENRNFNAPPLILVEKQPDAVKPPAPPPPDNGKPVDF